MDAIDRLKQERSVLSDRIAKIDSVLSQYDAVSREAIHLLSDGSVPDSDVTDDIIAHLPGSVRGDAPVATLRPVPAPEFEPTVIEILSQASKPMDRAALFRELSKRGVEVGKGEDRDKDLNALSARLYRMSLSGALENRRGVGYWLPRKPEERRKAAERRPEAKQDYFSDLLDSARGNLI